MDSEKLEQIAQRADENEAKKTQSESTRDGSANEDNWDIDEVTVYAVDGVCDAFGVPKRNPKQVALFARSARKVLERRVPDSEYGPEIILLAVGLSMVVGIFIDVKRGHRAPANAAQ